VITIAWRAQPCRDDGIVVTGGSREMTCYNSSMSAENDKQRALEAIEALPDDAMLEDAIECLCFLAKVDEGLRQSEAGRLVGHDEVAKQSLS
jgi:predicted transcriptional regulator